MVFGLNRLGFRGVYSVALARKAVALAAIEPVILSCARRKRDRRKNNGAGQDEKKEDFFHEKSLKGGDVLG